MCLILLLICMFDTIAQEIPLQRIDFYGRELWIKAPRFSASLYFGQ